MNSSRANFDNTYRSLGNYIPPTEIPVVSAVPAGVMRVPVYTNMDYQNPNYDLACNGNAQNYSSVTKAYMQTCDADGKCLSYKTVQNPCNSALVNNASMERQRHFSQI